MLHGQCITRSLAISFIVRRTACLSTGTVVFTFVVVSYPDPNNVVDGLGFGHDYIRAAQNE